MSQQVLESTRFSRKSRASRPNQRIHSYSVAVHEPTAMKQREVNVAGCTIGGITSIEVPLVKLLMDPVLRVDLAATGGGNKGANYGANLIKSIEVTSGSNILHSYNDYATFISFCLQNCPTERRKKVLELFGSAGANADQVFIPLPVPGSSLFYGFDNTRGRPLNLGAISSKAPLMFRVEWNTKANLVNGDSSTFAITNCVLQFNELLTSGNHAKPFATEYQDIKIWPSEVNLSANQLTETSIESLTGSIAYIWTNALSDANKAADGNKLVCERIDEQELILDGERYYKAVSKLQQVKDQVFMGVGDNDNKATGNNIVSFTRYPFEHIKEGMAHTSAIKRIGLRQKATQNLECRICTVYWKQCYSQGGVINCREM